MSAQINCTQIIFQTNYYIKPHAKRKPSKIIDFKCFVCGIEQTCQPRLGPAGKNTLCNKCGIRWKKQEASHKKMKIEFILCENL